MTKGTFLGPNGIPVEVYVKYQEHILPILLETYNKVFQIVFLPDSFYDATIVVLLKPDEDPKNVVPTDLISLLNSDYTLTKILASPLNTIILTLILADQTGFMLYKSTLQKH